MDVVMGEHGAEELRKGRDEPRKDVVEEEWVDYRRHGPPLGRA